MRIGKGMLLAAAVFAAFVTGAGIGAQAYDDGGHRAPCAKEQRR